MANRLKVLRVEKDLTIAQLSELSGVNVATISNIENDKQKASPRTLKKLAPHLGVDFADLLDLMDTSAKERGLLGGRPKKTTRQVTAA